MLHIGHGNYVSRNKILSISKYKSASMYRLRDSKIDSDEYIDCSNNRGIQSVVIVNGGVMYASSFRPISLVKRWNTCEEEPAL